MRSNIDEIYTAGIRQDEGMLREAIHSRFVDEFNPIYIAFTAAGQLAYLGHADAADFLVRHGKANSDYVAYGAALGGRKDHLESLLLQGASMKLVAEATAQAGNREYAEELLKERGANLNDVAYGAAFGGDIDYVNDLLSRGASIHVVAEATARAGNKPLADELISQGANVRRVAYGAALGGHYEHVEVLLLRGANIHEVAYAVARSGDFDFAESLISRGADINFVASGAASAGHRIYAEALLLRGAHIKFVAGGAAIAWDRDYTEELLSRVLIQSFGFVPDRYFLKWDNAYIDDVLLPDLVGAAAVDEKMSEEKKVKLNNALEISETILHGKYLVGFRGYIDEMLSYQLDDLTWIVESAAFFGHRDDVEKLLVRGADLPYATWGAIKGGYCDYAESLLSRKNGICYSGLGTAAEAGCHDYFEVLLSRGGDIENAADGLRTGANKVQQPSLSVSKLFEIKTPDKLSLESQLAYFPFFKVDTLPKIFKQLKEQDKFDKKYNAHLYTGPTVAPGLEKRIVAMSKHIHSGTLNHAQALTITDPACRGMLYLLMLSTLHDSQKPFKEGSHVKCMPVALWHVIFGFLSPGFLTQEGFEHLGFYMSRSYMQAQLSCSRGLFSRTFARVGAGSNDPARRLASAVNDTHNIDELNELVATQANGLPNHPPNNRRFCEVVSLWHKRLNNEEIAIAPKPESTWRRLMPFSH